MNETFSDTISVELILSGPQSKLVREVKLRSKDDPVLKAKVKALFAGSKFSRIPYKDVVKLSQSDDINEDALGDLSAEQIGYAVRFNTFGSNSGGIFHSKDDLANSTFAGLWLEPSFFNHDDNPNVCWVVMGNLMVMRAATDIKAGDELTITYSCELRINERRKTLKDYAFNYDLNHSDKTLLESISNKSDLISNLKIQSQKSKNDKQKMEILNRAIKINNSIIKEHYPLIADNQPIVMGVLYDKMDLYLGVGNRKKAKEAAIQILDSFPCYVNEDFLHTIMESFPGKADVDLYEALQKCVELIYGTKNLEMFF
ncbi:uncharacterized protein LOC142356199 [Convolutriloba macropyga]|uniref:uncharacterized protein LOC142356199 n=1 Tax=Convolutriloba macropyga TaxID=536237 RepID=UPI003F523576